MARHYAPNVKACRCGHASAFHHRLGKEKREVCNFPKCRCKAFVPSKPEKAH